MEGWNELCNPGGRSVASKLSVHEPKTFFLRTEKEINEKKNFVYTAHYSERREILGWAIKGQIMAMNRGKLAAGQF